MKLLFVHDHVFCRSGGEVYSSQFTYSLFERYLRVFTEVSVVGRVRDDLNPNGLSRSSGERIAFHFGDNLSTLRSFAGRRQKERVRLSELVDSHDAVLVRLPSEYGLLAATVASARGRPYGVELVGCAWEAMWNYGSIRSKLYAPAFFARTAACVRRAAKTLYVTDGFLQRRYPVGEASSSIAASDVVLNPPDEAVVAERLARIRQMTLPIKVGTIGSFKNRYKGIHIAIRAIAELVRYGVDLHYHVLGSGEIEPYQRLARSLGIEARISFDGVLPSGRPVLAWLDEVDIYIQPSLTEGLPRALLEAMSRGCPAVGSAVGGIPDLLDPEMTFRRNKSSELAERIRELALDRRLMERQARRSVDRCSDFRVELLEAKRDRFLRSLCTEAG